MLPKDTSSRGGTKLTMDVIGSYLAVAKYFLAYLMDVYFLAHCVVANPRGWVRGPT